MKTRVVAGLSAFALIASAGLGAVASAAPAEQSVVGGTGAHPHHVHLGNGECLDINSVFFEPDDRGLHRGADASNGHESGPFHGPCH